MAVVLLAFVLLYYLLNYYPYTKPVAEALYKSSLIFWLLGLIAYAGLVMAMFQGQSARAALILPAVLLIGAIGYAELKHLVPEWVKKPSQKVSVLPATRARTLMEEGCDQKEKVVPISAAALTQIPPHCSMTFGTVDGHGVVLIGPKGERRSVKKGESVGNLDFPTAWIQALGESALVYLVFCPKPTRWDEGRRRCA